MSGQYEVLIVGGGIVGLTAALAMAQRNYSVAVIDAGCLKADITHIDARVYAINKASQVLLSQLGVWQHLDSVRISPYQNMHVWDAVNGASINFDSRFIAEQNLGSIIEESVLKQALLHQCAIESKIDLFPQNTVDKIINVEQGIKISSRDSAWEGKLLFIADGANSPTRQKLQIELTSWSYNQHALVTTVNTEKPHQSTAYQVFNPDGPLAFLPLVNPHQCSIVWSTDPERVQRLMELNELEFNSELTQAFGNKLGLVKVVRPRHQFPLQMRHVKQYVGNRWLLIGDAAHTIHPLAGLGLNVGLADITTWLKHLDQGNGPFASSKMLGAYQRERKHAVWQIILLMEGLKRLFSNSHLPLTVLRGLGLGVCNELTPIKRLFIQHAAG